MWFFKYWPEPIPSSYCIREGMGAKYLPRSYLDVLRVSQLQQRGKVNGAGERVGGCETRSLPEIDDYFRTRQRKPNPPPLWAHAQTHLTIENISKFVYFWLGCSSDLNAQNQIYPARTNARQKNPLTVWEFLGYFQKVTKWPQGKKLSK